MTDYSKLDYAIELVIQDGCTTFYPISLRVAEHAEAVAKSGEAWRVTDRRLQALRKSGALAYTRRTGWVVR